MKILLRYTGAYAVLIVPHCDNFTTYCDLINQVPRRSLLYEDDHEVRTWKLRK